MTTHGVTPTIVAEHLLWHAGEASRLLTPMQILKLVYVAHGWMLGLSSRPLIDEPVEAWRYGPVVRSVYKRYRKYRGNPISDPHVDGRACLDAGQQDLLRQISENYGNYSGIQLSRLTHQPGTPWSIAWNAGLAVIPDELIKDYYRRRAEAHR